MARQRNYRAEYQRRIQLERERAEREGREFSRAKARGHSNVTRDRLRNRLRYWQARTAFGLPRDEYKRDVDNAVWMLGGDNAAIEKVIDRLKVKRTDTLEFIQLTRVEGMSYDAAASQNMGRVHFFGKDRQAFLPVTLFYYHGYL